MKRVFSLMLTTMLLFSACLAETPAEKPRVTGTFIQPWAFSAYSETRWAKHLDYLLEAGIDTVILQWTADTPKAKMSEAFYPTSLTCSSVHKDLLPRLLAAAKERDMKVFVGLNLADEWWDIACSQTDWNEAQAALGLEMAAEILDLYKEEYPETLYGWYFSWEMFNGMMGQEELAASFLNLYLDGLTTLSPDMPLMLSPFIRSAGGTPDEAGTEWTKVFAGAHFREGDIFCLQDAVGAEHVTIDEVDAYFSALKKAVDTKPGLLFWANTENFRTISTNTFGGAPVERFVRQMEIEQPYVSGFVTFAYSHYYTPDMDLTGKLHAAYLEYINN